MPFRTRNSYYLRISEKTVIPVYVRRVYLDERHLEWMSDRVLQHVLADLRPNILPKLKAEADIHFGGGASAKKSTVETHRGETYQFCYFIRSTEPHSVVIKTRSYLAAPPRQDLPQLPRPPPQSSKSKGKRKGEPLVRPAASTTTNARKKRKTVGKGSHRSTTELENDEDSDSEGSSAPEAQIAPSQTIRRSARKNKNTAVQYDQDSFSDSDVDMDQDVQMTSTNTNSENQDPSVGTNNKEVFDLDVEEEEEKPKPILQLKYRGFSIYGQCLCVVVEPWPLVRSSSRTPNLMQERSRLSMPPPAVPNAFSRISRVREPTPLFLPDDSESEPIPQVPFYQRSTMPLYTMEEDDDDDQVGGMMAFSQALNNAGDSRAGAADDDEEMESAVLFGDADEIKEL